MKNSEVLIGEVLQPREVGEDDPSQVLVIRNKDKSGRRLGVFTKSGKALAGQVVSHADVLHTPVDIKKEEVPVGYGSGVEVKLSGIRTYHQFAVYNFTEHKYSGDFSDFDQFAEGASYDPKEGIVTLKSSPLLSTDRLRTTVSSGDFSPSADEARNNLFASFSIVFGNKPYHIGLDMVKHPALITADLNLHLNSIHPNLRGYVAPIDPSPGSENSSYAFFLAAPEGLEVIIPTVSFKTLENLSPYYGELGMAPMAGTHHLNSQLSSAKLIDYKSGMRDTVYNLDHVNTNIQSKTASELIRDAFVIDLNTASNDPKNPSIFKNTYTIPATALASLDQDERLVMAMLKLQRRYTEGKVFRILHMVYKTVEGNPIPFYDTRADILVTPARALDDIEYNHVFSSVFINELGSADSGILEGIYYPTQEEIRFAESGGLNEECAAYVALFPTPNVNNRSSIFFRDTTLATTVEIVYELVDVDVTPTVKLIDLDTLDYHYIKTVQHAFIPLRFHTEPLHKWNIEFITEGQAERYQGINHGPANEGDTDIHMSTDGTVGEMVILSNIDYTKVKAPTTGEPNYHYTGQIGAQGWLYQNLPWVNVVTTRAVDVVKSDYKVVFPSVEMTGELTPLSEPLVSKQSDGTIVITGRFSNPAYEKNVFLHSLLTKTEFSIKGAVITPVEPVTFDANTGNFSARMAINDLVEPGPGTHVFRVTTTAKYPWLTSSSTYTQTMNIEVLAAVEGIEDDVTFIANSEFGTELTEASDVGYRLIDMDTGEILATGPNALALKEDAQARGLVDVDLIFGTGPKAPIGDCTPSDTYVQFTDNTLEPGQVLRLAYEVTDADGVKSVKSDVFIVDTTNPVGYSTNERGPEPLELLTKLGLDAWSGEAFYARTVKNPGYSDSWKDTCHLGETWITGRLFSYDLMTFTSSEDKTAHLKIVINGVEHDLTADVPFYSEADGDATKIRAFFDAFVPKIEALGLHVRLEENDQFYNGTNGGYNSYTVHLSYEIGQFNSVSVASQPIIGSGYTARWRVVDFGEECKQRKTGYTHPDEYVVRITGYDEKSSEGDFIPGPLDLKFDTCENLGIPLAEGELDYYGRLAFGSQEEGPFYGQELPVILHTCGQVIYY